MELWFPEREFFMRSHGQVRFIKISSRLQKTAVALTLIVALAVIAGMGTMSFLQWRSSVERVSLLEREADVATSEERLNAYRANLGEVTQDLEKRQDFIEEMMKVVPADAIQESTVTDSSDETADMVEKVSMAVPEAAALAKIEARQLVFVEGLTRYADNRSKQAMWALNELGLDPKQILATAEKSARGGPFEAVFGEGDEIDPRFERLGLSLADGHAGRDARRRAAASPDRYARGKLLFRLSPRSVYRTRCHAPRARFPGPARRADLRRRARNGDLRRAKGRLW